MLPKSIFIVVACAAKLVAAAVITIHDFSYVSVGLEEGASSLANDDGSSGIVDSLIYEDPDSSADADAATQPIETMAIANPKDIPKFGVLCASAPQAYTSKDIADAIATFTTAPKHCMYSSCFYRYLNRGLLLLMCRLNRVLSEAFHESQQANRRHHMQQFKVYGRVPNLPRTSIHWRGSWCRSSHSVAAGSRR